MSNTSNSEKEKMPEQLDYSNIDTSEFEEGVQKTIEIQAEATITNIGGRQGIYIPAEIQDALGTQKGDKIKLKLIKDQENPQNTHLQIKYKDNA